MQNWSGLVKWEPEKIFRPTTEEGIQAIVKQAIKENRKVRVIGSGHSFSPLCVTQDYLVSLDDYQGLTSFAKSTMQATALAGTKIFYLNELLAQHDMALENMGDINTQSIAGAISTGTHGTGTAFRSMSSQVTALRFINGLGEIVSCSETENRELFKAAQISLGALGIITEITLQCVPGYTLELIIEPSLLSETLTYYTTLNKANRNFEFFWFPNTDRVMLRTTNITTQKPDGKSFSNYFQDMVVENYAFKAICELSVLFPSTTNRLSRMSGNLITKAVKVNESYNVFSTPRLIRFNEMEYNVPLEAYSEAMKAVTNWVNKNNKHLLIPLENRFVKQDDIYLSPAYQRDSAYIAVHAYIKKDHRAYFKAMEEIFKAHDGRPHWGKMHTMTATDLETLYPEFGRFQKIRQAQDPHGIFLSPYLSKLFAVPAAVNQT